MSDPKESTQIPQAPTSQHHHYPFQGYALKQQQQFFPTTLTNIFAPKACDENQPTCDEESGSIIDQYICDFCMRTFIKQQRQYWHDFDHKAATQITKFKQDYIMSLGDVRVRSIIMAVSSASLYKLISIRTGSLICRTRNLAVSFGLMGVVFVPELFNPFLVFKKAAVQK